MVARMAFMRLRRGLRWGAASAGTALGAVLRAQSRSQAQGPDHCPHAALTREAPTYSERRNPQTVTGRPGSAGFSRQSAQTATRRRLDPRYSSRPKNPAAANVIAPGSGTGATLPVWKDVTWSSM